MRSIEATGLLSFLQNSANSLIQHSPKSWVAVRLFGSAALGAGDALSDIDTALFLSIDLDPDETLQRLKISLEAGVLCQDTISFPITDVNVITEATVPVLRFAVGETPVDLIAVQTRWQTPPPEASLSHHSASGVDRSVSDFWLDPVVFEQVTLGSRLAFCSVRSVILLQLAVIGSAQAAAGRERLAVFARACVQLKAWARAHHVYGGLIGFLSGSAITSIVSTVIQKCSLVTAELLFARALHALLAWSSAALVQTAIELLQKNGIEPAEMKRGDRKRNRESSSQKVNENVTQCIFHSLKVLGVKGSDDDLIQLRKVFANFAIQCGGEIVQIAERSVLLVSPTITIASDQKRLIDATEGKRSVAGLPAPLDLRKVQIPFVILHTPAPWRSANSSMGVAHVVALNLAARSSWRSLRCGAPLSCLTVPRPLIPMSAASDLIVIHYSPTHRVRKEDDEVHQFAIQSLLKSRVGRLSTSLDDVVGGAAVRPLPLIDKMTTDPPVLRQDGRFPLAHASQLSDPRLLAAVASYGHIADNVSARAPPTPKPRNPPVRVSEVAALLLLSGEETAVQLKALLHDARRLEAGGARSPDTVSSVMAHVAGMMGMVNSGLRGENSGAGRLAGSIKRYCHGLNNQGSVTFCFISIRKNAVLGATISITGFQA